MAIRFVWQAYLNLAQRQHNQALDDNISNLDQEALLRTTISRAYYAAFISARNYLRDVVGDKNIPLSGTVHSYVVSNLQYDANSSRRFVGRRLRRLRDRRNMADYDDVFTGDLFDEAQNALDDAQRIVATLTRLS